MLKRLSLLLVLFAVAACADNTAPDVNGLALARGGGGRWATTEPVTTESSATTTETPTDVAACPYTDVPDGEPCVLRHAADAPQLFTYDTSFVAVQGRRAKLDLWYLDEWSGGAGWWYATIEIPRDAQLVDETGRPLKKGESVTITVELDRDGRFLARFGAHGSTFMGRNPATLKFNLEWADMGGAHPENSAIWYQPTSDDPWDALSSTFDAQAYWIEAAIYHFSNYAVAW